MGQFGKLRNQGHRLFQTGKCGWNGSGVCDKAVRPEYPHGHTDDGMIVAPQLETGDGPAPQRSLHDYGP